MALTPPDADSRLPNKLQELHPKLLTRIRIMMGEEARAHADSGDFYQGLCLEALRDERRFQRLVADDRALLRWLTAIARNNIRDEVRKRREALLASFSDTVFRHGEETTPSQVTLRTERQERIAEALEALAPDYRRVIELRDLDGLSLRQVGDTMKRSEEAARKLHRRALIQLGRTLGEST